MKGTRTYTCVIKGEGHIGDYRYRKGSIKGAKTSFSRKGRSWRGGIAWERSRGVVPSGARHVSCQLPTGTAWRYIQKINYYYYLKKQKKRERRKVGGGRELLGNSSLPWLAALLTRGHGGPIDSWNYTPKIKVEVVGLIGKWGPCGRLANLR